MNGWFSLYCLRGRFSPMCRLDGAEKRYNGITKILFIFLWRATCFIGIRMKIFVGSFLIKNNRREDGWKFEIRPFFYWQSICLVGEPTRAVYEYDASSIKWWSSIDWLLKKSYCSHNFGSFFSHSGQVTRISYSIGRMMPSCRPLPTMTHCWIFSQPAGIPYILQSTIRRWFSQAANSHRILICYPLVKRFFLLLRSTINSHFKWNQDAIAQHYCSTINICFTN